MLTFATSSQLVRHDHFVAAGTNDLYGDRLIYYQWEKGATPCSPHLSLSEPYLPALAVRNCPVLPQCRNSCTGPPKVLLLI